MQESRFEFLYFSPGAFVATSQASRFLSPLHHEALVFDGERAGAKPYFAWCAVPSLVCMPYHGAPQERRATAYRNQAAGSKITDKANE